jgi:hypothetical protein
MALRAEHAQALLVAEKDWAAAKIALEEATARRQKARDRCRAGITLGERTSAGGVAILVTLCKSGRTFRLKDYLDKNKLTKAMTPFVTEGTEYDRWTVKAESMRRASRERR